MAPWKYAPKERMGWRVTLLRPEVLFETLMKIPRNRSVDPLPSGTVSEHEKPLWWFAKGKPMDSQPIGCGFISGVCFFFWGDCIFRFSFGLVKCRMFQHFLAKLTYFTLARQHPQHRFQHPPHVRPTSPASPTNREQKL